MALPAPVPDDLVVVMLKCSSAVLIVQIFEGLGPVLKYNLHISLSRSRSRRFDVQTFYVYTNPRAVSATDSIISYR
jgi:hypothetical protein